MKEKTILFVGALGHQHISTFVHSLRNNSEFSFWGIDITGNEKCSDDFEHVFFVKKSKSHLVNQLKRIFLSTWYIIRAKKHVSAVQFHSFSIYAFIAAPVARLLGLKVSYFIWGSDIMRANKVESFLNSIVYHSAHSVVCDSSSVVDIFKLKYSRIAWKIELLYFGSSVIDKLIEIEKEDNLQIGNCETGGKIVVMCGYNGRPSQNHKRIFDSLLPFRDKVFLIIPMTYGCENQYKSSLIEYLSSNGFKYIILDHFLSETEWCYYEKISNVFIHMQDTDAFSSSVAEHLYLGNIVINAEWIIYPDLLDNKVYYLTANFDNLISIMKDVLENQEQYVKLSVMNKPLIVKLKSLNHCVTNYWVPYYLRLLGNKVSE